MATGSDTINFFSGVKSSDVTNLGLTGAASAILSAAVARTALAYIDTAIARIAERRGTLGAIQNRLEHTINNLRIASENLSAANSRIKDADFAYETAIFTRNQIMVQAATAILAQANVLPQTALSLLQ
jgi:flagellin